jgi:hypothetical protein
MSKYPLDEESLRPYSFLHNRQPEWLTVAMEGLASTVLCSHLQALEKYVAEMPTHQLEATLLEAENLTEDEQYSILCNVEIETVPLVETVGAEIAYRLGVEARKRLRLKK